MPSLSTMGRKKVKCSTASEGGTAEQPVSDMDVKLLNLETKVDKLVDVVAKMGEKIQAQASATPLSPVPAAHSSLRVEEEGSKQIPTFEELKSDVQIQAEVAKRLHQYDHLSRTEQGFKGKSTDAILKSGRYRAGIHKVRRSISWPQDFCTTVNGKQPTYDDLSALQWMQGFIYCVLDENNPKIRTNMLLHGGSVLQDAIELSFPTAKRAHGVVLQEIEKGVLDWDKMDEIERVRSRNAQRIIASSSGSKSNDTTEKVFICKLYNKGTCKYEKQSQHVEKGVTYQHYCSYCYLASGKKFEHSKMKCHRLRNDNKNASVSQQV